MNQLLANAGKRLNESSNIGLPTVSMVSFVKDNPVQDLVNIILFPVACLSSLVLSMGSQIPYISNSFNLLVALFAACTTLTIGLRFHKKTCLQGSGPVVMTLGWQRSLRILALTMPIVLLVFASLNIYAWLELKRAEAVCFYSQKFSMTSGLSTAEKHIVAEHLNHVVASASIDQRLLNYASRAGYRAGLYEDALTYANRSLALDEFNSNAKLLRWQALKKLPAHKAEFVSVTRELKHHFRMVPSVPAQILYENMNYEEACQVAHFGFASELAGTDQRISANHLRL